MKKSEVFITSRVAAQQLGVSLRTIQLWVENGSLRAWKTVGGHRRIARNSVEEILLKQRAALGRRTEEHTFTVVVVEDDTVLLQLYEMKFMDWALPVDLITATNGFEGMLEIGAHKPDLVISDLDMPGMDGFKMISAISNSNKLNNTQIIVVTGLSEKEIVENRGLPSYIPVLNKPVNFNELKALLDKKLRLFTQ